MNAACRAHAACTHAHTPTLHCAGSPGGRNMQWNELGGWPGGHVRLTGSAGQARAFASTCSSLVMVQTAYFSIAETKALRNRYSGTKELDTLGRLARAAKQQKDYIFMSRPA